MEVVNSSMRSFREHNVMDINMTLLVELTDSLSVEEDAG